MKANGGNAEQIRYWNEVAGPKWVVFQGLIDEQIRPLGEATMDRLRLAAGEAVIDVGCGCGSTTLELARQVGRQGRVLGLDVSEPMLDEARRRAAEGGIAYVRFEAADAQTFPAGDGNFDVLFSRFGVMFFADPAAAFANLRRALRPGGRVGFVCWQDVQRNPWVLVPMMAALEHLTITPPPPDAPGPFALADAERLRGILEGAGFSEVAMESHEAVLTVGGRTDLESAAEFIMQMGPLGRALREVTDPAVTGRVADAVRRALEPYWTGHGVELGSASWIVTARTF